LDAGSLAAQVRSVIAGGAPFSEMAAIYSPGSASGREGGDFGWREVSKLNPGIAELTKGLEPGELSEVVSLGRGEGGDYWVCQYNADRQLTLGRHYTAQDQFLEERVYEPPQAADTDLPAPLEFYIVLMEDKRPARIRPLDEVRQDIEGELLVAERARLQKQWVDRLKEKSFVRYFGQ
jgi:parvulin-like peptidyl-prolyl isomerase